MPWYRRSPAHPWRARAACVNGDNVESNLDTVGRPLPAVGEHAPPVLEPYQPAAPTTTILSAPVSSPAAGGPPSTGVMVTLIVLAAILLGYSIVVAVMGDTALAATAGTGAIALVGEIARRLLAGSGKA